MKEASSKINGNYYDMAIILVISLVSFGVIGDAFQPIRIITFLLLPFVLAWIVQVEISSRVKKIMLCFLLWYSFLALSMLWTVDFNQGLKELFYYPIHFLLFLLIIALSSKANNPKTSVSLGWILVLVITLPVAIYEIITLNHLPMNVIESDTLTNIGGALIQQRYASVTFGNYNTYVVNLLYCLPFLFSIIIKNYNRKYSLLLTIILSISILVIFVNGSRGGILVSLLYLLFFIYYFNKKSKDIVKKIIVIFIFIVSVSSVLYLSLDYIDSYFAKFLYRFGLGASELAQDSERLNIINVGLKLLSDSVFIGQGVGSQYVALSNSSVNIPAAHNVFLEVLIQQGVFVFFGFMYLLYKVFFNNCSSLESRYKVVIYSSLFAFIPLGVINSGYLLMPSFWVFLSSVFIMSNRNKQKVKL